MGKLAKKYIYIRSKSILGLPIRYPDNRDGVLYLEINLTSGAFNSVRLEVLEMDILRLIAEDLSNRETEILVIILD